MASGSANANRKLAVVSGYYGFGNLGDEAILEQLVAELKRLMPAENIVVLSADPAATSVQLGVRAINRWNQWSLIRLMPEVKLFVSGGGGLFQETNSPGSVIFYGSQIMLARALGAKALIYAQGLGPLKSGFSKWFTRQALSLCQSITLRDPASSSLAQSWGLAAQQTADPVWCLEPSPLPPQMQQGLSDLRAKTRQLVGLSLRPSANFSDQDLDRLAEALRESAGQATFVLLSLQPAQDSPLLARAATRLKEAGLTVVCLDTGSIKQPSQWITLLQGFDLVVAMRFHALILALKSAVPVLGIGYDPKVTQLLSEFRQPMLILANNAAALEWSSLVEQAFSSHKELSEHAKTAALAAKNLACQNFNDLARILNMQSDP